MNVLVLLSLSFDLKNTFANYQLYSPGCLGLQYILNTADKELNEFIFLKTFDLDTTLL
jgi:hypothetical protein